MRRWREFHYLHHPVGGGTYADPAEMSARIAAAAAETGLGLTLLPVIYEQGGVDGRALTGGQLRFGIDRPRSMRGCWTARRRRWRVCRDAVLGVAPHSLRAVSRETLAEVAATCAGRARCTSTSPNRWPKWPRSRPPGARGRWNGLLANLPVDGRWCLIHATQMTPAETAALARTGAVAGLCPITEANLGDGIFDGPGWLAAGGRFGRRDGQQRPHLAWPRNCGCWSIRSAWRTEARAVMAGSSGQPGGCCGKARRRAGRRRRGGASGAIAVGEWADLLALDTGDLRLEGLAGDQCSMPSSSPAATGW